MSPQYCDLGTMTLNHYQGQARSTLVGPASLERAVYAVVGEAGELAGAMDKFLRGDYHPVDLHLRLEKEAGDVLWSVSFLADRLGMTLEAVAQSNLRKLRDRQKRDVLQGDGDDR